jgi:hypothetical protein
VAVDALVLHNPVIKRLDKNWIGDGFKSECHNILDSINALDGILLYYVVWSMAIHA